MNLILRLNVCFLSVAVLNCLEERIYSVSLPVATLSEFHSGCNEVTLNQSRSSECLTAMHQFCQKVLFNGEQPTSGHLLGVSREVRDPVIGLSCVSACWYGNVSIGDLKNANNGCELSTSQSAECLSAIHRYCSNRFGSQYAGISQEVVASGGSLEVACFERTDIAETTPWNVLTDLQSGCVFNRSATAYCFSAASRWCQSQGASGGITQEFNSDGVTVACYDAAFSGDVFVRPATDVLEQTITIVTNVCNDSTVVCGNLFLMVHLLVTVLFVTKISSSVI